MLGCLVWFINVALPASNKHPPPARQRASLARPFCSLSTHPPQSTPTKHCCTRVGMKARRLGGFKVGRKQAWMGCQPRCAQSLHSVLTPPANSAPSKSAFTHPSLHDRATGENRWAISKQQETTIRARETRRHALSTSSFHPLTQTPQLYPHACPPIVQYPIQLREY